MYKDWNYTIIPMNPTQYLPAKELTDFMVADQVDAFA